MHTHTYKHTHVEAHVGWVQAFIKLSQYYIEASEASVIHSDTSNNYFHNDYYQYHYCQNASSLLGIAASNKVSLFCYSNCNAEISQSYQHI